MIKDQSTKSSVTGPCLKRLGSAWSSMDLASLGLRIGARVRSAEVGTGGMVTLVEEKRSSGALGLVGVSPEGCFEGIQKCGGIRGVVEGRVDRSIQALTMLKNRFYCFVLCAMYEIHFGTRKDDSRQDTNK